MAPSTYASPSAAAGVAVPAGSGLRAFTIDLTRGQFAKLDSICERRGVPHVELLSQIIWTWLAEHRG
jgi:hypothetical protein